MKVKVTYSPTQEVNELDLELATTPKGEWIIGRSPECELPLESPDVSRIHAKFYFESGNYYFCDTGSRNGSIINNKLAEKNQPYILKHGDSIQIGDYILMLEDIKQVSEQLPETVFRVIDPALFSRPVSENVNVANITNQPSEVDSEFTGEVISPTQEEVAAPEVVYTASSEDKEVITAPESQIAEEKTFIQPQDITIQPPEIVTDAVTTDSDEDVDLITPIAEERTFIQPQDITIQPPEIVTDAVTTDSDEDVDLITPIVEERSFVQSQDITTQPPEIVTDVATTDSDENVDLSTPILQEFTTVQPRDINIQPSPTDSDEDVDLSTPILQEFTTVQPRDINIQPSPTDSDVATTDSDEAVDLDTTDAGEGETVEVVSEVHPEATTDTDTVTENTSIEPSDTDSQPQEVVSNVDVEATEAVPEALNESQAEVINAPLDNNIDTQAEVTEVFSNEYVDFSTTSLEEVNQELTAVDVVSTSENSEIEESISTPEASDTPELVGETSEAVAEVEEVEAVDNVEADTESEPSQMSIQKNIVLIAHESKKSELAELVAQHQEFFSQSLTISWPSVSEALKQQAGLTVTEEIPSPTSGGYQKINVLLGSGDVLAVIFLRDFLTPQPGQANEEALLRICNINQVLVATNVKTAKAIIHYLKHIAD